MSQPMDPQQNQQQPQPSPDPTSGFANLAGILAGGGDGSQTTGLLGGGAPPAALGQQTPQMPTLAPQPQQPQQGNAPPRPRPILADLISGLIHPQAQSLADGRPASRVDVVENFLGSFMTALSSGMAAAHGPGANVKGFAAAVGAPYQQDVQRYQMGQQAQAQQASIQGEQARTAQTQAQTAFLPTQQAAQLQAMSAQPRWDPTTKEYLGTMNDAGFSNYLKGQGAASVAARSKQAVAELGTLANQGKVAIVKPAAGGGFAAYDKQGNLLKVLEGSVDPAMLQKVSTTQDFLPDGAGGFLVQPKTTVSGPVQPTAAATPSGGLSGIQSKVPALAQNATPQQQVAAKVPALAAAQNSPRRIVGQGVGVAFDPQSNSYIQETAQEAQAAGHQQFQKITLKESEENRQLNNRLADVAQKITRYENTLSTPISDYDKGNIAGLMTDLKLDTHGISIPFDRVNAELNSENVKTMSQAAKDRVLAFWNARESLVGYQRVLSGSAKSNEKAMELNLQTLPPPSMPDDFTKDGIGQFKENLKIAGQGLPRMKGITSATDILGATQTQQPQQLPASIQQALTRKWANR